MKNQDIGKQVKITKVGMFQNFTGKIVSMKAQVDLGAMGIWGFDLTDLYLAKEAQISPVKELSNESDKVVSPKEKSLLKAAKQPKAKAVKTEKRKYTKKAKS